jgi:hypothetical protein
VTSRSAVRSRLKRSIARTRTAARRSSGTSTTGVSLEVEGHNLLLLDEPTDKLGIDSAEAFRPVADALEAEDAG